MNCAAARGLSLGLSANGSACPDLSRLKTCGNLTEMIFSMPGFSQAPYDRIHGLEPELVKSNIRRIIGEF